MQKPMLILASGSAIRAEILRNAGIPFEIIRPDVDESKIKNQSLKDGLSIDDMAIKLAEAKCLEIARHNPGLVIGSDQILDFEGIAFDKPADMKEARDRFLLMSAKPHDLVNATVLARDGKIIWRNLQRSTLTLRALSEPEIDAYLNAAGEGVLASVGAYQVENLGARLFEKIDGDHTAVLGLSLLPLLEVLRREGLLGF